MSGITKMLFGGGGDNPTTPVTPTASTAPAVVPPPPERSADQVRSAADRQVVRFYGADPTRSSANVNGTPQDVSGTSRVARFLGNVGRL